MSEERYSYQKAIRQFVYIELPVDTDHDGRNDLVRADIIRPAELDGKEKIPAIMDPSPYYALYERHGEKNEYEHPEDVWNSTLSCYPFFYDNYFVPRGYAVILLATAGTSLSAGFCDIGGPNDVASANAVVDWLNGRAKGYMTRERRTPDNELKAYWSNGLVGAIGKSYDGSVANAMAATGIEGLRTIVPISAISSQYRWYHPNAALLDGDDADGGWFEPDNFAQSLESTADGKLQRFNLMGGLDTLREGSDKASLDYNAFWAQRNYASHAKDYKASVFIVHGVNDLNVMMNQVEDYWRELGENGVPRKIWVHQYGHDDPFDFRNDVWMSTLDRWFEYWLKGIDNGIMNEPIASVEDIDGNWHEGSNWPEPEASMHVYRVSGGEDPRLGELVEAVGADSEARTGETSLVASLKGGRINELVDAYSCDKADAQRLLYVSAPLQQDMHVSGHVEVEVSVKASVPRSNLCASLIEYGEGTYIEPGPDTHAMVEIDQQRTVHWQTTPQDKAVYKVWIPRKSREISRVVTRGWISTDHREGFDHHVPAPQDEWITVRIPMLATDSLIRAGHRMALMICNNTERLAQVPDCDYEVRLDAIRLRFNAVASPCAR
ncbi:CocE/NonD family hydrolase [Bifidobacterium sp. ESL0800]|uniref:CocE/NonD family hydrolase n=1 Tax=Bifidobacterium sp. ESL0800 TaxID=2983236 RepID=UPI0023F8611E|nr:CocE/NonD family hydrolase [Bifidobacterium sp. ESL0800]WEV75936.1 CocE/NonD family hydrolase [Bifidobacterium sp. ESL0800]